MKIGILTHQYIINYGAFLQTYALQETIKKLFPDDEVFVINFINRKHYFINKIGWYRFNIKKESLKSWSKKICTPSTFRKESKKLNLTKRVFTINQVNKMMFDCIIVGSDEVWNWEDKKSYHLIKFGKGLRCKKIIAYAPSVGKSENYKILPKEIQEGINNFDYLSFRDEATSDFLRYLGKKKTHQVLDPTFLYEFDNLINSKIIQKKYILLYYCDNLPNEIIDEIKKYAEENNLLIIGAGEYQSWYSSINVNISINEWLSLFSRAEFILTGTFHGVVFSIKNRKQFFVYLTNVSRIKKVESLLKTFNIEGRNIIEGKKFVEYEQINYIEVNNIINEMKEKSISFLKESIKDKSYE